MVRDRLTHLTKLGFRRDIKLFLAALVGFLVVLILSLLMVQQTTLLELQSNQWSRWELVADLATRELRAPLPHPSDVASQLTYIRSRYPISAISLQPRAGGPPIVSGSLATDGHHVLLRQIPRGALRFEFDASPLIASQKRFYATTAIVFVSTLLGSILLFLYLPKIVRPIEQLLDEAREVGERGAETDETEYIINTFRTTIATLKRQELELQELHVREKSRADDLERITATLTRSLTSGFIAVDAAGLIVDLNRSAREILNIADSSHLTGLTVPESLGDSSFATALTASATTRTPLTRYEVSHHPGSESVIGLTTVPLTSADGAFLGMIALFADLSPSKKLEARLQQMQTLADLGEISAGIAHEFRNSLSTILGYLKLAGRQPMEPTAASRIRSAEEEATLLSAAVERFLNFASPLSMTEQRFDLAAEATAIALRLTKERPEIQILSVGPAVEIDGDAVLLSRAVENVLRNSIQAIEQKGNSGGTLRIVSSTSPPALEVHDDGIGLDPRQAGRYLLPFQSDRPGGFGLGLSLTNKIVLMHGGSLKLEGAPGTGACVRMEFPPLER
ncbi:MAG TPA: ATP-binding protein [Thermoanaerobaculia bacterium]|nr:ATP-binding protein [Thermoanaerobaculia bacterium]